MTRRTRKKFEHYRKSLEEAGLSVILADSLICPLCWREVPHSELSNEHIVPQSVGGNDVVAVCITCNSVLGSKIDSHLAQRQSVTDALAGQGTLRAEIIPSEGRIIANLRWDMRSKHFTVVPKATNPEALSNFRAGLESGRITRFDVRMHVGYNHLKSQTAVLKAAYLILFKCYGYEFAKHDIVQRIRQIIDDPVSNEGVIKSLVIRIKNFEPPFKRQHFVAPGKINGVEFFLVVIRVRKHTTTYYGAFLPAPVDGCDGFFKMMEQFAKANDNTNLSISRECMFW